VKTSYYASRRIIKSNRNEVIPTLIKKRSLHNQSNDYATFIEKRSLIKSSSKVQPTLIVMKYNEIILSKFKIVKFTTQ